MRLSLSMLAVVVIALTAHSATTSPVVPPFEVTGVTLTATSQTSDRCPTTISFSATITYNSPGTVTYTLLRSDKLVSPRQTIVFETAGTQTIGWARVVNGQSGATRAGWQQVEIVAPNSVLSIRAEYTVTCSNTQEQSEPFQGVRNQYYVAPRRYPLNSTDELPLFSPVSNVAASASATSALPAAAEPPAEPEGNSCGWYSAGPTNINGRITDIAIDPQNNQHVFVTSVGGIWRSVDGGRRWERVSDEFLTAVSASIAVNPRNSNEVLAGAGEPNYHRSTSQNGIWRSLAGGQRGSWTNVSGPELTGAIINRLKFDPLAPNNVYAATSAGVYIGTRNAGDNFDWTLL